MNAFSGVANIRDEHCYGSICAFHHIRAHIHRVAFFWLNSSFPKFFRLELANVQHDGDSDEGLAVGVHVAWLEDPGLVSACSASSSEPSRSISRATRPACLRRDPCRGSSGRRWWTRSSPGSTNISSALSSPLRLAQCCSELGRDCPGCTEA